MRRGAFAVALLGLMLLAGCFGPSTASWGTGSDSVEVDFDRASTSFTSTLGLEPSSMDDLQAVGCSPGEEDLGTNKTQAIKFTGYLAASQIYEAHTDQVNGIGLAVTTSVAIHAMPFKQAAETIEGEGSRVDLKDWNDPMNPQTGAGSVDLDEIDADEDSRWYILGLIPTTENIQDGMLSLGEWHQAVTVRGYLVSSNASNAYGYHSIQTVSDDCTLDVGNQNREQLYVMVTGIELDGSSVTANGEADDEWVHGDVPILGRTGFILMFFIVGVGGAVGAFILSKMFVLKGARDTMKVLLGQVGMDNIKKVKQDVKKAKSTGLASPATRQAEQRSKAQKELPKSAKKPQESALAGFDLDSILSNDDSDASPVISSSRGSSVVVTEAAQEMESSVSNQASSVSSPTPSPAPVWDAPKRSSSAPTSVVSTQPEPEPRGHFSSVAPTRSADPEPKPPQKKKTVRKRKAAAKPVEEEPEPYKAPAAQEKETFQDEDDFSDFSF
tara:strand:- start:3464 stop:4957 length:1494 start_codon:yes stop_codon:yes gene_type:complete